MKRDRFTIAVFMTVLLGGIIFATVLSEKHRLQTAHTKDLFAMDTYFTLEAYGPTAEDALESCARKVQELEDRLSVTRQDSDIGKLNEGNFSDSAQPGAEIAADTFELIKEARKLGEETEGALDITLYPVLREWGFTTGNYHIPDERTLRELLKNVDYTKIYLDEARRTVRVPEGTKLDLGAVAKGYTGDCLIEILKQQGVTSAMLDLGGNIQVLGAKPDGSPWRVAIKSPFESGGMIGVLEVTDKAVVTSGSYERYFVGEDGEKYGHILNPLDGYPVRNDLASVTIVGESGTRCDGLSTALFVMGRERAVEFWKRRPEFEMILVTEDGKVYFTQGLRDCFESGGEWNVEEIVRYEGGGA